MAFGMGQKTIISAAMQFPIPRMYDANIGAIHMFSGQTSQLKVAVSIAVGDRALSIAK
jgi:hypothetical protein